MSGSGLDDMLSLVRQIAEQAKHDQQRSLKAKREQMVRQAEAAVSNREAELAEQLAKKEDEYFNELQTLMEGLNEEVVALLAGGEEDEVACKPSKDKEVKKAGDAVLEALGAADSVVKSLDAQLEPASASSSSSSSAMEGVDSRIEAHIAAAAAKHKERAARHGRSVLDGKVGELQKCASQMDVVVAEFVNQHAH